MEPVTPDYDGAWVGAVVPALLEADPPDWVPEPVRGARAVVLCVLDGLGWSALDAHPEQLPVLSSMQGGAITTVAPSTTAAALTSISTGVPPATHGVVGYRMRVGGEVLNVLRWTMGAQRPPEPAEVQPRPAFDGRALPVVTRAEFADTGFTAAHLAGAALSGWQTPSVLVERCRLLVAAGQRFVYGYYDGVDKVAHPHGLRDTFYPRELAATDRLLGDLLAVLPGDVAVVVTSDHGQVHVEPDAQRHLGDVAGLVSAYSGDARFRYLHARPGAGAELLATARACYGEEAWVRSRAEVLDEGWLGRPDGLAIPGRIGDVVVAPHAPVAYIDPGYPREQGLLSFHGSLTAEEMLVPLKAARGRA